MEVNIISEIFDENTSCIIEIGGKTNSHVRGSDWSKAGMCNVWVFFSSLGSIG